MPRFHLAVKTTRVPAFYPKNNLSQEELANQLHLGGKQIIYFYEKGQRIMKLPEFVQFIQDFNETVIVDKSGIKLLDEKNIEKECVKMNTNIKTNLELVEEKGSITFYKDVENGKLYQNVPPLGLIPVVDGYIQYTPIEQMSDVSIKYNSNGVYGYSIWVNNNCIEDDYWILEQVKDAVEDLIFNSEKEKAIQIMVNNVLLKLEEEELEINELDFDSSEDFLTSLDNTFLDGGIFRCECFTDIAIPYAMHFGEIESDSFNKAIFECIDGSFEKLKELYIKED